MLPSVSVVINTYNRARTLPATLAAMAWQRHPRFEVIVVNGPSTDDTEEVLARFAGTIRTARCPEANLSMSRNIGLAMAAGEIVAYTDDDAVPEPDWLEALATPYLDPQVGAVGGFIRDHTGYAWQCRVVACDRYGDNEGFETVEQALDAGAAQRGRGAPRFLSPTGANSSFRRSALLAIGGFDEEYAYFLDETDVAVRLLDAGWSITYAARAEVHHKYADSHLRSADRIPRTIFAPARSKAYFCVRHALPRDGFAKVAAYLARYRADRRRDKEWLRDNGLIERSHCDRLLEEIDRGTELGVADGFRFPEGRLVSGRPEAQELLPFPVPRPAAARLRICFLSQDYPPGPVGGIAVWTHTLATALAARGHEVSVVTRTDGHARVDFEEGVWVHRVPQRHHLGRGIHGMPDLPGLVADWAFTAHDEVLRIRARRGLDVVSAPIWDVEGAACLADGTLPVVTSLHSTYKLVLPSKRKWQEDETYRRLHVDKLIAAEAWMLERSQMILANSEAILRDVGAAYAIGLEPSRVRVVPHGLAPEAPAAPPRREPGCRILYVGRFETRKGIDVLAEAIPLVLDAVPEARFVLAGDPDVDEDGRGPAHRTRIEALVARYPGRVEMTGVLPREALVAEYARADVFVAPSRYESFGLIFLEAMMHGAACVGTRAGGIPEVVEDGVTGLLVPPEDPAALAAALSRLAGDGALRRRLGEAGLDAYRSRFTAARMAAMAEGEYASVARRTPLPDGGPEWEGEDGMGTGLGILARKIVDRVLPPSSATAAQPTGAAPLWREAGPLAPRDVPPPRGVFLGDHRVLTQTRRSVRLILDTRDIIMTPIVLLNGEWEPETSRALLDILRPGMNFVDVGANMGYFTCLAGLAVRGGGQVWSFEPDPVSYEFLADNVALNWLFENMHLERKGVYSRSTTLTLFKREKYVGNTSLGEVDAGDLERIMDRQTPHQVEVVSLDEYFLPGGQPLDLVKIDVEGAEPHVIQGMTGLLAAQPKMRLMIEWSPGQIRNTMKLDPAPMMRLLQEHGFRAAHIGARLEPVDLEAFDRIPHGMVLLERDG